MSDLFPDDTRNRKVARLLQERSGESFAACLATVRRLGAYAVWLQLQGAT